MDIAALIISILSIIVSTILFSVEMSANKKINDINLESELFKDIVKDFLTNKFPQSISNIHFQDTCLSGIDDLQQSLIEMRKSFKFYMYSDITFYNDLKSKLQELEDYVVSNEGKKYSIEEQSDVMKEIRSQMTGIYSLLKNKYKNGWANKNIIT